MPRMAGRGVFAGVLGCCVVGWLRSVRALGSVCVSLQDHGPWKFRWIFDVASEGRCHVVTITSGTALQDAWKFVSLFNSWRDGSKKVSSVIIVLKSI